MSSAKTPEEPEIERVLEALDVTAREMERSACAIEQAEKFKAFGETQRRLVEGNRTIANSAADAARLIRALRADFLEYAQHMLPSPRHKLGCLTREMYPPSQTFNFKCDCGLDAARERWSCK